MNALENISPSLAIEVQNELRKKVEIKPLNRGVKLIGGADVSLNRFSTTLFAGITVISFDDFGEVEHSVVRAETEFPYIPGLLSFREAPALIEAWKKLKAKPDVLVVDGQGIAHPRRIGIASHVGVLLDVPAIGCAKSLLTGSYKEPGNERGSFSFIYDRYNEGEVIGAALRTKKGVKPVIVSPGHKITLEQSIDILLRADAGYRIPEPTRRAHELVNAFRRGELL